MSRQSFTNTMIPSFPEEYTVRVIFILFILIGTSVLGEPAKADAKPRARDLGIPFEGSPGPWNAITDVKGVEVGYTTLISGEGRLQVGNGPIRTGVTAILPQGTTFSGRLFAAWHSFNGNGEMTGTTWVEESGVLGSPILITNSASVGTVRDAVLEWSFRPGRANYDFSGLPVVAETLDAYLNDVGGFHVRKEHVFDALDGATTGPVAEGNVGGGTGMMAHLFKGGSGTSSRVLNAAQGGYTVGVFVQANHGRRETLRIAGVPVGKEIRDLRPTVQGAAPEGGQGSIIVIVATDAPLLPHQLKRIVKRVSLGIGIVGGLGENSSGDIFLAFSTANPEASKSDGTASVTMLPNERIDPLFDATVSATEEAIVNAMVAAETMTGINGNTVYAIPHDRLKKVLAKYNRLVK